MDIEDAVKKAVNDCIRQDILRKFLLKHKARVIEMSILYEYDEKKQRMLDHKDGVEEGIEIGEQIGDQIRLIIMIQKKVKKTKTLDTIADELESTVEEIKPLYDAVIKYPPDTDPKEIYSHL